jgi:hypothetical protein
MAESVFVTQGGGYCTWDEALECYVWHSDIPDFLPETTRVGDPIPDEWGVAGPVRDA